MGQPQEVKVIRLRGYMPGEFGGTDMTFFCSWDGRQISRVQSLSRDASVFVELDFSHGKCERDGASEWAELVWRADGKFITVPALYRSLSITTPRADRDNVGVDFIHQWSSVFRP